MDPFSNGAGPAAQRPRLLSNRAGRALRGVAAGVELTRLGSGRWGLGTEKEGSSTFVCPVHLPDAVLSPGRPPSFPTPATQAISPAVNPLASFLHPTLKPSLRAGEDAD